MYSNEYINNFSQSFVVAVVAAVVETFVSCEENKKKRSVAKLYNAQEQIKCLTVNIFFQRANV